MEVALLERAEMSMEASPARPKPCVYTEKRGKILVAMHCSAHLTGIVTAISSQHLEAAEYFSFYTCRSFLLDVLIDLRRRKYHVCFNSLDAIRRVRAGGVILNEHAEVVAKLMVGSNPANNVIWDRT
eukprot:1029116-Pyramimonas_sp.AAC.1